MGPPRIPVVNMKVGIQGISHFVWRWPDVKDSKNENCPQMEHSSKSYPKQTFGLMKSEMDSSQVQCWMSGILLTVARELLFWWNGFNILSCWDRSMKPSKLQATRQLKMLRRGRHKLKSKRKTTNKSLAMLRLCRQPWLQSSHVYLSPFVQQSGHTKITLAGGKFYMLDKFGHISDTLLFYRKKPIHFQTLHHHDMLALKFCDVSQILSVFTLESQQIQIFFGSLPYGQWKWMAKLRTWATLKETGSVTSVQPALLRDIDFKSPKKIMIWSLPKHLVHSGPRRLIGFPSQQWTYYLRLHGFGNP